MTTGSKSLLPTPALLLLSHFKKLNTISNETIDHILLTSLLIVRSLCNNETVKAYTRL